MFLQAVIGDWFGLVNGKMQIITTFEYVLDGGLSSAERKRDQGQNGINGG
jgi:hypothetical protein